MQFACPRDFVRRPYYRPRFSHEFYREQATLGVLRINVAPIIETAIIVNALQGMEIANGIFCFGKMKDSANGNTKHHSLSNIPI